MKHSFYAPVAAVALVLMTGLGVQANSVSPDNLSWTYNFNPGAPAVTADGNPGAGVTFTNESPNTARGSSDVVATNLKVFSTALGGSPDKLTTNGAYSITLNISANDNGTPVSGSLTFTGKLSGYLSSERVGVTSSPIGPQSINLGSYTFTVALSSYSPPGLPSQSNFGSIGGHVTVTSLIPAGGPPGVLTPEPGTMVLSAFGFSLLGGAAWRKRRQARVAVPSCA